MMSTSAVPGAPCAILAFILTMSAASIASTRITHPGEDALGRELSSALANSDLVISGFFADITELPARLTVDRLWLARDCGAIDYVVVEIPDLVLSSGSRTKSNYQERKAEISRGISDIENSIEPYLTYETVEKMRVEFRQSKFVPDLTEVQLRFVITEMTRLMGLKHELYELDGLLDETLKEVTVSPGTSYVFFLETSVRNPKNYSVVEHGVLDERDQQNLGRKLIDYASFGGSNKSFCELPQAR